MIRSPRRIHRLCRIGILLFSALAVSTGVLPADAGPPGGILLEWRDDEFVFKTDRARIEDILREVARRCGVTIDGLEQRADEAVTFEFRGARMETGFRQFLRQLNVRNYAFEYIDNEIGRISVLVEGMNKRAATAGPERSEALPGRNAHVIEIQEVTPGSQAELLNFQSGDLILAYDNQEISTPQQLVRMVSEKADWEKVDLLVVRDGDPFLYVVNGGLIGVRISTAEFPRADLETILNAR